MLWCYPERSFGKACLWSCRAQNWGRGIVVNLLESHQLNHHTSVSSGVLAKECAAVLVIFLNRRFQSKKKKFPLRDDALRTPEHAFVAVPDFSHQSSYISDLPSLDGLRMHYVDSGPEENKSAWLCLHGPFKLEFCFSEFLEFYARVGKSRSYRYDWLWKER